jgi:membrane associated rhomboid family serine protease
MSNSPYHSPSLPLGAANQPKPVLAWTLLALNIGLFFVLSQASMREVFVRLMLWPTAPEFRWWQLLSHCFLHGGMTHLAFNMIGLWQFGTVLERHLGTRRFAALYFTSVLFAAVLQIVSEHYFGDLAPMVGASGGLFGLLYAYAACFPQARITPLIPPIPMPAWFAVSLFGAAELYFGFSSSLDSIAHFAHLGGILGAFLVLPLPWRRQKFRALGRH